MYVVYTIYFLGKTLFHNGYLKLNLD